MPEYYLYPAELGLLKRFSREIVQILFPSRMPEPASSSSAGAQRNGTQAEQNGGKALRRTPVPRWRVGDWGSDAVGRFNGGVNGEEGMDANGKAHGRREGARQSPGVPLEGVVLELGAGSLSKTRSFPQPLCAISHPVLTSRCNFAATCSRRFRIGMVTGQPKRRFSTSPLISTRPSSSGRSTQSRPHHLAKR